jgi:hypothetical protein
MAGSIGRSYRLLGASWRLLGADPKLLLLPFASFVLSLAVAGFFFSSGLIWGDGRSSIASWIALYVMYSIIAFIGICFDATVVAVALKRLDGEDASIRDGWAMVRERLGTVIRWALVAATVGVILRAIQERLGVVGWIAGLVGSIAWGLVTFFVLPVLLFEPVDVRGAIRRSAGIFRQRWGEQITASVTIGAALFVLWIPLMVVGLLLMVVSVWLGVAVMIASFVGLLTITTTLTDVFNAALYRYAVAGQVPEGFTAMDFESVVKPRSRFGRRPPPNTNLPERPDR